MTLRNPSGWTWSWAALVACSCLSPSDDAAHSARLFSGRTDSSTEQPDASTDDADGGADAGLIERCDGFDNDADGLIDEDLVAEPCPIAGKRTTGLTECVSGQIQCRLCTPGATKKASCGCDQERTDICMSDGTWLEGACDGCETIRKPCELCVAGERIVRRCDSCPDGGSCGSTCVGSVWECVNGCKWEQKTDCQLMTPTCSGDMSVLEACGNCGTRQKACDGCFWDAPLCMDQGLCKPGQAQQTPCFQNACSQGTYATAVCTKECTWAKPTVCQGCTPGVTNVSTNCVARHPECGQMVIENTCTLQSTEMPICGGAKTLPVGRLSSSRVITQCRPSLCVPGSSQPQPCTLPTGQLGTRQVGCKADCTPDVPTECEPGGTTCPTTQQCTPNAVTKTTKACGPNACGREYEETKTCFSSGCGQQTTTTQTTACPACQVGQTKQVFCKTPGGACGTLTVKCSATCEWESSPTPGATSPECVASPSGCVPGTTRTDYASCGTNTCGRTYPRIMTCMASGCGFQFTSEDRSVCPSCTPNATETTPQLCKAGTPSCGYVQRTCNASTCDWQTLPCPVCG